MMADEFMRMGGRDPQGNARPVNVDENGNVLTQVTGRKIEVLEEDIELTVDANGYVGFTDVWTNGFSYITVAVQEKDLVKHDFALFHQSGSSKGKFWGLGVKFAEFSNARGEWERFEVPSFRERLFIQNLSSSAKTYVISVYGIA